MLIIQDIDIYVLLFLINILCEMFASSTIMNATKESEKQNSIF